MRAIGIVTLLFVSVVAWWYLFPSSESGVNSFGPGGQQSTLAWLIYLVAGYVTLLAGSFIGTICRLLLERKGQGQDTIDIVTVVKSSITHVDFWLAMAASPVIYFSIYRSGGDVPASTFFFLALQTGFSSNIIVTSFLGGKGAAALPQPHARPNDDHIRSE